MTIDTKPVIVPMAAEHLEKLAQIEQLCFSDPWSEYALSTELSHPHAHFVVALCQGEIAGYGGLHHIMDEGYIANIAVHPDFRRRGVGRALMQSQADYAINNSLMLLTLEVRATNSSAMALYTQMGYSEVGRRKNFYRDPVEDAIIMTRFFLDKSIHKP